MAWKRIAVSGHRNAGRDHVEPQGHGSAGIIYGQGNAQGGEPEQQSGRDEPGVDHAGSAETHTSLDKIECAIEDGGAAHQDHAGANRDQAQRRAQMIANRQRSDDAREQGRGQWLQKDVCAQVGQTAAKQGAGGRTHEYQSHRRQMLDPENYR
jgi:hypothetical protein